LVADWLNELSYSPHGGSGFHQDRLTLKELEWGEILYMLSWQKRRRNAEADAIKNPPPR
jgi:hypothetical protein